MSGKGVRRLGGSRWQASRCKGIILYPRSWPTSPRGQQTRFAYSCPYHWAEYGQKRVRVARGVVEGLNKSHVCTFHCPSFEHSNFISRPLWHKTMDCIRCRNSAKTCISAADGYCPKYVHATSTMPIRINIVKPTGSAKPIIERGCQPGASERCDLRYGAGTAGHLVR